MRGDGVILRLLHFGIADHNKHVHKMTDKEENVKKMKCFILFT